MGMVGAMVCRLNRQQALFRRPPPPPLMSLKNIRGTVFFLVTRILEVPCFS
jgi:hypothetical protein